MLPLSVPSYDEDRLQMSIGTITGVAQWTVNTACDWATYAGGMHGTEDMSFLDIYNLHMQTDASFRQSAARIPTEQPETKIAKNFANIVCLKSESR